MAYITLNRQKLEHNFHQLDDLFKENKIEWAAVSKLLCGNELFLNELIRLGIKEICDSRISNLRKIKQIDPDIQTVYIKPPAHEAVEDIVRWADASFNTEYRTIKLLSDEARKQDKMHKIIIMIELGDLREGIMGEHLLDFYEHVFELPNIKVTGIGSNLNCLHGVMPTQDKLIQLSLYKQLIEARFKCKIPWVTGGTSVVIPMLYRHQIPAGINHFRVGESLFLGSDLVNGGIIEGLHDDVFKLYSQIIEITEKPKVPNGPLDENPSGEIYEIDENDYGKTSYRAIIDVGLLDVKTDYLFPEDKSLEICGASSDMLVLDLGTNEQNYKVGDFISFTLGYMGALLLFNSDYIEKRVVNIESSERASKEHQKT